MATHLDNIIGVDLTDTPTTSGFALGTVTKGTDGTEWKYVQAGTAITQYDTVGIDENFTAAPITKAQADDGYNVGFAQVAFAASDYGWVATKGSNIQTRGAAACAPDVALYTTSTAGVLDDTSLNQTKLDGVVFVATASATNAEIIATYPKSNTF